MVVRLLLESIPNAPIFSLVTDCVVASQQSLNCSRIKALASHSHTVWGPKGTRSHCRTAKRYITGSLINLKLLRCNTLWWAIRWDITRIPFLISPQRKRWTSREGWCFMIFLKWGDLLTPGPCGYDPGLWSITLCNWQAQPDSSVASESYLHGWRGVQKSRISLGALCIVTKDHEALVI